MPFPGHAASSIGIALPSKTVAAIASPTAFGPAAFQMLVIGRLNVRNVQEPVAADSEIDERRLDARLDINDAALVDVADITLVAGAVDIEFFKYAVFEYGDPALLRLQD